MQRFRESRLYFPKKSFPTSFLWMCLCVCACVNVNSIARLFRLSVCLYKNVCEPSHVHVHVCVCVRVRVCSAGVAVIASNGL